MANVCAAISVAFATGVAFTTGRSMLRGGYDQCCEKWSSKGLTDEAFCSVSCGEYDDATTMDPDPHSDEDLIRLKLGFSDTDEPFVPQESGCVDVYRVSSNTVVCLDHAGQGFCKVTAKTVGLSAEQVFGPLYSLPSMQSKRIKESVDGLLELALME